MITIDQLEVMFDAERQRDEVVFAELFARHIASHEDRRARSTEAEARAATDQSVAEGSGSW